MQGPLARLGVVEVEMGISMRELIFDVFGGMREGSTFKGIQTGGVSAGPLVEEQLDVPMDFDSMKPLDGMLGSGGFVVFDQTVCAVEFAPLPDGIQPLRVVQQMHAMPAWQPGAGRNRRSHPLWHGAPFRP